MTLNYDIDKEIRYLAMKLVESKGITKEEANVSYCDKNLLLEKPRQCRIMLRVDQTPARKCRPGKIFTDSAGRCLISLEGGNRGHVVMRSVLDTGLWGLE